MLKHSLGAAVLMAAASACSSAAPSAQPADIAAAMADPARGDQASQDSWRHGSEVLTFAGIKQGDKIVDLIPGVGYWTRLFARATGPNGHVYGIWPAEYAAADGTEPAGYRALAKAYPNVSVIDQPARAFAAPESVDLVFTSKNYHDYPDKFMGNIDPSVLNRAVFAALKPGGTYVILDHAARPGSGMQDADTLHRIDPATVKAQVVAAGFEFVGESPALANPADDHTKPVFDKSIATHTDQFLYKFRKPAR